MNDEVREIRSYWWGSGDQDVKQFGILTLAATKSPTLEVFFENSQALEPHAAMGETILGRDEHGHPVTLLFVSPPSVHQRCQVSRHKYTAGYALIGIHLERPDQFIAHSLRFGLQHLYGWTGRTGFRKSSLSATAFDVSFTHPEDEWYQITPDLDLGLHTTVEAQDQGKAKSITEDAALTFRGKAGFSLSQCNDLISNMRMLLHFAILDRVYPCWLTAYKDGHGEDVGGRWRDQDIEVWSPSLREAKSELPFQDRWVFRLQDYRGDVAGFVGKWIAYYNEFEEALLCYSSTVYHSLPSSVAHLLLAQALETYHGIEFQSFDNHDFRPKVQELVQRHAAVLAGLEPDLEGFVNATHATRNYYTHYNPKWLQKGALTRSSELIRLNEKLKLLFQACVLSDIGVPADRLVRLRRQIATSVIDYV